MIALPQLQSQDPPPRHPALPTRSKIWPLYRYSWTIQRKQTTPSCPVYPMVTAGPCPEPALRPPGVRQQPPLESWLQGMRCGSDPRPARLPGASSAPATHVAGSTHLPFLHSPCLSVSENQDSPLRTLSKCICKMHQSTLIKMSAECRRKV